MPTSILATKLFIPPTRPEIVPRPRLVKQLNEGLQRKLSLISAPAGFGKTTLVSEWVDKIKSHANGESQIGNQVAWLSLDEGDSDPASFLAYLIAALNRVEGIETAMVKNLLGMLQSPQPPPTESFLTSLINELVDIPDKIIFVLDDYHVIESPQVDDALAYLVEHMPPQMHLVIASRTDPQLPLSRLRARGHMIELRAADLRFTTYEAAEFLNRMMGLDLSAEDIAALESRTEGWIAGLQLAAISMKGRKDTSDLIRSFTGSHRYILDYLIEEVLEQQSDSVQNFLLQTAILNRLTSSLCDALTGQDNGQETLEILEHANLFIVPLDEERRWYRYHHLFADLLRQRLRQAQPEQVSKLHHLASAWHQHNGFIDEAIEHALRAEEFERAAQLIEDNVDAIWQRGEHMKLRGWLAALSPKLVLSKPHLCILRAWDLFTSGQQEAAEQSLQAAEGALGSGADQTVRTQSEGDQLSDSDKMKIKGRAAAIRAFLAFYRGDVPVLNQYARQALELLPEDDLTWRSTATVALGDGYSFMGDMEAANRVRLEALETSRAAGNDYMTLIAGMKLAVTLRQQGRLGQVIGICEQQLQLANKTGLSQTIVIGWLLAIWGEVLAEKNDLDEAIRLAEKGAELTGRGRDVAMIGWSYLCLIRVLFSRGELAAAEEIIEMMENIAREYYVPPWIINLLAAWQARIWLAEDRLEAASQWAEESGLDIDGPLAFMHETERIVLARILIAQGRMDEADAFLQRLLEGALEGGRISRAIEMLMLQAFAYQTRDDTARAMISLEQALILAEPGGFMRTFVDEGLPMAHLLYEALSREIAPDYVRRLLAAFPTTKPEKTDLPTSPADQSELVEPLSEREIEVLQLIAGGLTNREIAARLYLSLNTVKVHTRNIYGKLGVNNRTQAIRRGRALGILPPN
jgi:LuxR family maltose regulon positive regulatory protein